MTDDDMVKVADSIAYERRKSWMKLASKARKGKLKLELKKFSRKSPILAHFDAYSLEVSSKIGYFSLVVNELQMAN